MVSCGKKTVETIPVDNIEEHISEPVDTSRYITTIQEIVDWANSQEWTEEEIAHLDSMNEAYRDAPVVIGYPVRGAERNLDTIVNHLRIHFMTKL